jgi:DNA helicase-2/ATP-dependent DNA helicase PcrA
MSEIQEEQKYLDKTIGIIKDNLKDLEANCSSGIESVKELSKYHWETKSEMDDVERANSVYDTNRQASITNDELYMLRKLRRALKNPFFGKITIDFDGDQEDCYIGFTAIKDDTELVVNDWRSPIASLFYNSRLGNAEYKAPMGMISCNLVQRRQIKTKNGKIKRIINSDIHLDDDELQEVLNQSSNSKMKSIVTTIQEEQNNIIRNVKDRKIIVQGCAGSGKTSVALHRLAYLLYNDKKSTEENMLIFSPSDAFSSYISNVLPELGERNAMETTFSDFANSFVKKFKKIESYTEFVSKYYDGINCDEKNRLNKFKFSKEYSEALKKYIKRVTNNYRFTEDFMFTNITIPCNYMNRLLEVKLNDDMSLSERIDMVTDDIYNLYPRKDLIKKHVLRNKVERELVKSFDPRVLYNRFLESEEFVSAYGKKQNKLNIELLEYPDLIGMLYLNFEMMGYPENNLINHLVIDEVQDYAPLQMEMISKMFQGATLTVLGDANQTINPYHKYDSLKEMQDVLGPSAKYMELNKAYRSTPEIVEYTNNLLGNEIVTPVRNESNVPVVKKEVDKSKIFTELANDIVKLKENGFNRICIITKSIKEARAIYEGIKDYLDDVKVLTDERENNDNTLVSPSYLAKGLEFDAVIAYNDSRNPYNEEDKYLYYVTCTRAQHNLMIYNEPKTLRKELK